jgi:hypothetical protein
MARMIPTLDPAALAEIKSAAERRVYQAFRDGLPARMLVVHSLEMVLTSQGDHPSDAEADFVIFDPEQGILVVEVKGGGVRFDGATRTWCSTDRARCDHPIKDPVGQARRAKHQILGSMRERKRWAGGEPPRMLAAHAALFPDLVAMRGLSGPDRPEEILGGAYVLDNPAEWVRGVFQFWGGREPRWQPLGARGMAIAEDLFCGRCTVSVSLASSINQEYRRQIELTQRQARILRTLRYRPRAVVAGGAGTGKTVIALQHARALAEQGLQTLLVCYNRPLGDFLKRECQGVNNLHAMTFHQLCDWRIECARVESGMDLLVEAGQAYPGADPFAILRPFALARSTEVSEFRYQAIIVDEGQDFGDEFWMPIELLLANGEDTPLYVFLDPNQSIYASPSQLPIQEPPFYLPENCRNTAPIHKLSYRYYQGEEVDPPDIDGETPVFIEKEGLSAQAGTVRKLVNRLLLQEGLGTEEIVVLVLGQNKESQYQALQKMGAPAGHAWAFERHCEPGSILVDTARRFKGLEAPAIVLWGLEDADNPRDRELLYVAFSRARSRMWVVGSGRSAIPLLAEGLLRLAPLMA